MSYAVKEIYFTLQGEGAHTGRPAVFCRFSGCNLWTGRSRDRSKAVCQFCDTDFVGTDGPGGGWFDTAAELADAIAAVWTRHVRSDERTTDVDVRRTRDANERTTDVDVRRTWIGGDHRRFVVCTGGEPLLQLDQDTVHALHDRGFAVAVETNGTMLPPNGIDWICVSPKANAELVARQGDELKLVYPQTGISPDDYVHLPFQHFFLQPLDGPQLRQNVERAIRYCLRHPRWRLSIQLHKALGFHENATITDAYRVAFVPWPGSVPHHEHHPSDRYLYETQNANAATALDAAQRAEVAAGVAGW